MSVDTVPARRASSTATISSATTVSVGSSSAESSPGRRGTMRTRAVWLSDDSSTSESEADDLELLKTWQKPAPTRQLSVKSAKRAAKFEAALEELVETEESYVRALEAVVNGYMHRIVDTVLTWEEKAVIFSNIEDILEAHTKLLADLQTAKGENPDTVARVFLETDFVALYGPYCADHDRSCKALHEQLGKEAFVACLQTLQRRLNHQLPLRDYLLKPVQRILKYPLLLREQLGVTDSAHPRYQHIARALKAMQEVAAGINQVKRQKELQSILAGEVVVTRTLSLQDKLANAGYAGDLSRFGDLVDECSAVALQIEGKRSQAREGSKGTKQSKRHLYLFQHALLACKDRSPTQTSVKDVYSFDNCRLSQLDDHAIAVSDSKFIEEKHVYSSRRLNAETWVAASLRPHRLSDAGMISPPSPSRSQRRLFSTGSKLRIRAGGGGGRNGSKGSGDKAVADAAAKVQLRSGGDRSRIRPRRPPSLFEADDIGVNPVLMQQGGSSGGEDSAPASGPTPTSPAVPLPDVQTEIAAFRQQQLEVEAEQGKVRALLAEQQTLRTQQEQERARLETAFQEERRRLQSQLHGEIARRKEAELQSEMQAKQKQLEHQHSQQLLLIQRQKEEAERASSLAAELEEERVAARASALQLEETKRALEERLVREEIEQQLERRREELHALVWQPKHIVTEQELERASLEGYVFSRLSGMPCPRDIWVDQHSCRGYMAKLGRIHKLWRTRWFVFSLVTRRLTYFTGPDELHSKGSIRLQEICHCIAQDPGSARPTAPATLAPTSRAASEATAVHVNHALLHVVTPLRTFHFRAPDVAAMRVWVAAINTVATS